MDKLKTLLTIVLMFAVLSLPALPVLGLVGYVKNIVKLTRTDFQAPYKAEIIYGLGAISPLGALFGWFNIED